MKNTAISAKDYFIHTAKDSARTLDPKGCKSSAARKGGIIGCASVMLAQLGYSIYTSIQRRKEQ